MVYIRFIVATSFHPVFRTQKFRIYMIIEDL
jgi:hypothetical protein